jgi:NAD(P)-dependent dehydrogenase (short-subunit alcohol dehydrogenase family)
VVTVLSQFHIEGDVAVVTGASGGIGAEIAKKFADDSVDVAINSRSLERVQPVADEINDSAASGRAVAFECDVRNRSAVFDFVDHVESELGAIDVLVNNAAGDFTSRFEELSENGWKTIIDINLHGAFHCTQAVGESMRDGTGGHILNMVSGAGLEGGSAYSSHYGASKAALKNLTESLADEWKIHDIRVNCLAPGLIATPGVRDSLGVDIADIPPRETVDRPIGHPEEAADIAQFLCSPAASYLNGATIKAGVPSSEEAERSKTADVEHS